MQLGVWFDVRNPARWRVPWDQLYAETLEQIEEAEALGFASVWLSEHHITDDGYLPSIFPMLAAIAARTSRIRLGTAVMLAPFQHPLRFAEDAAFVDQLSRGRLDLGLALGYRDAEFTALGVPKRERGSRTDELVEIARKAWTAEPFSHRGRHWALNDVVVTPPPHQPGGPPIFIGGSSPAGARRAGRLGAHYMPNASVDEEIHRTYRAALTDHGHDPADFRVAVNPSLWVAEDPDAAWADLKPHLLYQENVYAQWFAESAGRAPTPATDLDRRDFLVGTPDEVVAGLRALEARSGCEQVFTWARPPGVSATKSREMLGLLAREVLPRLR